MFSHALILYQTALITFWEKTAKTMNHVHESFKGYQAFEFSYIKDLAEPDRGLDQKPLEGPPGGGKTEKEKKARERTEERLPERERGRDREKRNTENTSFGRP